MDLLGAARLRGRLGSGQLTFGSPLWLPFYSPLHSVKAVLHDTSLVPSSPCFFLSATKICHEEEIRSSLVLRLFMGVLRAFNHFNVLAMGMKRQR